MADLRKLEATILANGRVDGHELEELRAALYDNDRLADRKKADWLVMLHKRVQRKTPNFENFFYRAIKSHVLTDGRVNAEEAAWLRRMVFHDGKLQDEERKFLRELKGEARVASPEFDKLFDECMKEPHEQRTNG